MHRLEDHMLDVAACFQAVAQTTAVHRALECAAQRCLDAVDIARLGALAFIHDVGKANAGFQAKRWVAAQQEVPSGWPAPAGHSSEALLIFESEALMGALPVVEMGDWGSACLNLWRASISHHGRPVEEPGQGIAKGIWQPVFHEGQLVYDPCQTLAAIGQCLRNWFAPAFQPAAPLPEQTAFVHLFAGLVQFADWLGSDTKFFPYAKPVGGRSAWVWQRAREAVAQIGVNANGWREALPRLPEFSAVFSATGQAAYIPHPIQSRMDDPSLGSLLILESETGSGKTEAALWRFAHLFHARQVDSLYFALPTRVAATQLYGRTLQFAKNLFAGSQTEAPTVIRALSGYECADGHTRQCLPDFEVLWSDRPDERTAHKRWAAESSKRFLAAPIAVGTIDQALMGALQVRHAHMRHSLLARSLLVVDEVHASDAYMSTLLAHLIKAHLNVGGHALLLSATLGASARYRYQKLVSPHVSMPNLTQAIDTPYPALSDGEATHALPDSGRSKQVHWHVKDCIDQPAAIAAIAVDAAQQGAKVLVIRNTVPTALTTFREIEQLALQSGRACAFCVRGRGSCKAARVRFA